MTSSLEIYLRNHEAAAQAGYDLCRRTTASHQGKTYADELGEITDEVKQDLSSLRAMMRDISVHPDPLLSTALRVGERVGRLKPNGHLLRRAPLSDLVEIEAMLDAVRAKAAGWQALTAAGAQSWIRSADLAELSRRADSQIDRLVGIHQAVAAQVLAGEKPAI